MRVRAVSDAEALAALAADTIAAVARERVEAHGRFAVAFSGGTTPGPMLVRLASAPLPWERVHVFQVDERLAPEGHPDRNWEGLRRDLLARADVPPGNLHPFPVGASPPEAGLGAYSRTLRAVCGDPPVLDLVHLGLGQDGHTASLVPGDPALQVRDRDVALTGVYQGRRRMTLTFPAINRVRIVLWLVQGRAKAPILRRMLAGDPALPATRVRRDRAVVLTDALPPLAGVGGER